MHRPLRLFALSAGVSLSLGVYACSPSPSADNSGNKPLKITLVSYAVTQSAYEKIIPQFVEQWRAKTGQTVEFEQSYGGSGSQARAVIDGLAADVVALALALDTKKIEKAGLIGPGWEKEAPNEAIVTKSVVAFVGRDDAANVTFTPEAQREFAKVGFRPVNPQVAQAVSSQYPAIKNLATVKDLGGWDKIQKQFFDAGAVFDKIQQK